MSVYKHQDSPFYHYDFQYKRARFHGSTGKTNEREAEAIEKLEREKAKKAAVESSRISQSLKIDDVAARYWLEVGQFHVGADTTERDLARLITYFGPDKLLTDITDDDITKLVAWRRGHRRTVHRKKPVKNPAPAPLIAPATVNRSTTEVLKKLFTRCKLWNVRFEHEPRWKEHWLDEPEERVRELNGDEGERLDEATRDDYRPVMDFAGVSGLRLNECLLKWTEVDWDTRRITKKGKGEKRVSIPITGAIREILWPLRGQHGEKVFTYVAKRTRKRENLVKGQRYPITYSGLKSAWKRLRAAARVVGFRFHDKRHDFATKLLRETKNLKLVQRALNHANIKTTAKYAHVVDDEVAAGIEAMQKARAKSRKKSRKTLRKVS
jgi:integrase